MGTLVPPWYKEKPTSQTGLLVAAFFFGASITVAVFASSKAARQSYRSWRRNHKVNAYIMMVWAVISMCVVASLCSWLSLFGKIPPSIWYYVGMLFTWAIEIQCLMQILANRLSLILYNPEKARRLKIGLLIAIGIINISVFCIWVPARLQISQEYIRINNIWDRMEKAIFAVIDAALNAYFMHLVKTKLVAGGLTQYNVVYRYNLAMVTISISLDILLIGMMSLPDDAVYVQASPLTYLAKLNIEMNMAELLGKVVKRSTEARSASLPSNEIDPWQQPHHLGIDVFDREWLGSAKDIIMPPGSRGGGGGGAGSSRGGGDGGVVGGNGGGGQMHDLNMDILNRPDENRGQPKDEEGSTSGTQPWDLERWQAQWGAEDRPRSRVGSEDVVAKKDSGASGV